MTAFYVPKSDLQPMLARALADYQVFAAQPLEGELHLAPVDPSQIVIPSCRSVEPVKSLFFRPREDLGVYFGQEKEPEAGKRAVVGVTACDLAALKVLDWVFLEGGVIDPYYEALRNNTVVISTDCSAPKDVCFCTFFERSPYAESGFDANLSPIEGGYVLEIGSERGKALLAGETQSLAEATAEQLAGRDRGRAAVEQQVQQNAEQAGLKMAPDLQERVRASRSEPIWERLAEKCVECAACNLICPTCHCFLLTDLEQKGGFRRFKNWDACLYRSFAVEASGSNPRPRRADRLYGRMEKKLDFIAANAGSWGCVGCGRCVEACAGGIDLRETLRELINA